MIVSPFTPLCFGRRSSDGLASRYVQTFAPTDNILVELLCSHDEEPELWLSKEGDEERREIVLSEWLVNSETKLMFADVCGLEDGFYRLEIPGVGASNRFMVSGDDDAIAQTVLMQYSMRDNRMRDDALFVIAGMRRFFDLRLPGGFKDSDWTFSVDNEQFSTMEGDLCTLYSYESTQKPLTIGGADGVPAWMAELVNRALTCGYIYIDGERHERSGASVPEQTTIMQGLDSFVYKVSLQKVSRLNPAIENENLACIRRNYQGEGYRTAPMDSTDYNILIK